jgi:Flp pilus assembly protein TadG
MRSRLQAARALATRRESGQILILFAVFLIVLMVLAGSAYDYASIVVDEARLQNAVDAAALAGSDKLASSQGQPSPVAAAQTATTQYLNSNHVDTTNATIGITALPYVPPAGTPTPVTPIYDGIGVDVTRNHSTAFWPLVGIPNVTLHDAAQAHGARTMLDVTLVLDMTYSEVMSGSIADIENATASFIQSMHPTVGDPGGARISLARFGGVKNCTFSPPLWIGTGCTDDYTLLTPLTDDQGVLMRIANNSGSSTCPPAAVGYACPLGYANTLGTKLPNAVNVVGGPSSGVFTGTGSRNNPATTGIAHKVLIIMTDGQDEDLTGNNLNSTWDSQVQTLATALKPGATSASADDIEIYTVNFTCPKNGGTQTVYPDSNYCMSKIASDGSSGSYGCPAATQPTSRSTVDDILIAVSSSKAGSCDHYLPLKKGDPLPDLFVKLAGSISRGQLTQ